MKKLTLLWRWVLFHEKLIDQDKQKLMSNYTDNKKFTKYLTNKAKELNITLKELRKQIVNDLAFCREKPHTVNTIKK